MKQVDPKFKTSLGVTLSQKEKKALGYSSVVERLPSMY